MAVRSLPGPRPMRFVGVRGNVVSWVRDPIGYAGRVFREHGPLAALVRGRVNLATPKGVGVVLASGPELNRELVTQHDEFYSYALPGRFYPEDGSTARTRPLERTMTGLFHVNSDEHRRHKRLLLPAFHRSRIEAYRDDMVSLTNAVLATWRPGEVRDLWVDMTELTLKIATKTLFGEDAGERGVAVSAMMQEWLVTMMGLGMILPYDLPGLPYRRWLDLTAEIDRSVVEIVAAKRARGGETADMLSTLIHARDEDGAVLTEDELVGHAGVIFAAGHETSTNALSWTLLLLSQHPDVASDLVDELRGLLHGDAPTIEQLGKLPLLDAVVKESMRVLPPVPFHPRVTHRESELAGYTLPARTEIFISIYHTHHMPELFPEPERFRPARWETIKPTAFEYTPFSAGPRMCIGASFAMMEIKLALAMILQRFRVAPVRGARVDRRVAITMAPKHGLRAMIHPSDGAWRQGAGGVRGDIRELVELPD